MEKKGVKQIMITSGYSFTGWIDYDIWMKNNLPFGIYGHPEVARYRAYTFIEKLRKFLSKLTTK